MKIEENGDIFLTKFKVKDEKIDFEQKKPIHFGESVMTPLGKIKIEKTPFFGKDKEEEDDKTYKINVGRQSMKGAIKSWKGKISVDEFRKEASIVDITVRDGSARRAEDVLNTMIQVYNEDWIKSKNEVTRASSQFIDERLVSLSGELEDADSEITNYKTSNRVPDITTSAAIDMQADKEAQKAVLELSNELQMAKHLKDYIDNPKNQDRVLPVNSGVQNQTIDGLISNYNSMVLYRNALIANSSEESPVVQTIESQLADARKAIATSVDAQIAQISTELKTMTREKTLLEESINDNPNHTKAIHGMYRQRNVKESLYLYLLQKKEENQLNQAFTPYNTRVIARPFGESEPTSPNPGSVLALAFILGLGFPIGIIYVREVSNTKVRDKNDIKALSMPYLGEIPKVNARKHSDKDHLVVVEQGNRNVANEAFRVVRTNLNFMLREDAGCPVVMVTSFNPGSGKSFVTVNLALSLALRGKKVLVIDGDMRRNSSSAYVGNPDSGLAQCLLGKVSVQDAIVRGQLQENLDFLPGGKTPPNPTELLENGKLKPMIEELRKEYDIIFIDNAPIQMIADGRIFATVCTNTIFVVRAGLFERSMLVDLEQLYQSREYSNMALLLNDTSGGGSYGSYGKSYYAK